jgi:transcriptional regulator with XRE-family HTH domain
MVDARVIEFGAHLKRLRESRGVSQSRLAERAGFDHSYVSRLESGARTPTREAVDRLGEALGLEQSELDAMLAAAGFLPRDVASLLTAEPVIGEVLELLQNDDVPEEYRENIRQVLRLLADQVRYVSRTGAAKAAGIVAA